MSKPYFRKAMAEILGIEISSDYCSERRELPSLLPPERPIISERTKEAFLNALKNNKT